jgi:hypothetical protein
MENKSINNILKEYINGNNDIDKIKNDKLITLINQISGDGTTQTPKKIVGVSIIDESPSKQVGGFNDVNEKNINTEELMKQYLEDLKKQSEVKTDEKNDSEQSRTQVKSKRNRKIHTFYSESSNF